MKPYEFGKMNQNMCQGMDCLNLVCIVSRYMKAKAVLENKKLYWILQTFLDNTFFHQGHLATASHLQFIPPKGKLEMAAAWSVEWIFLDVVKWNFLSEMY